MPAVIGRSHCSAAPSTALLLAMAGFIVGLLTAVLVSKSVNRGMVSPNIRRSSRPLWGGWSWEPPGID